MINQLESGLCFVSVEVYSVHVVLKTQKCTWVLVNLDLIYRIFSILFRMKVIFSCGKDVIVAVKWV